MYYISTRTHDVRILRSYRYIVHAYYVLRVYGAHLRIRQFGIDVTSNKKIAFYLNGANERKTRVGDAEF